MKWKQVLIVMMSLQVRIYCYDVIIVHKYNEGTCSANNTSIVVNQEQDEEVDEGLQTILYLNALLLLSCRCRYVVWF